MFIPMFEKMNFVSCEMDNSGFYKIKRCRADIYDGARLFDVSLNVSKNELLSTLRDMLFQRGRTYFIVNKKFMNEVATQPAFKILLNEARQSRSDFITLTSPEDTDTQEHIKKICLNLRFARREYEVLEKLDASFIEFEKRFPCSQNITLKDVSQDHTIQDCRDTFANLLSILRKDVLLSAKTLVLQGQFGKEELNRLKLTCDYWLKKHPLITKLRHTANEIEPVTIQYRLHSAAVSIVRAIFYIFDSLVSCFSKHSLNNMLEKNSIFKQPKTPLSRDLRLLEQQIDFVVFKLDYILNHDRHDLDARDVGTRDHGHDNAHSHP
jgi:hypothetical protein